MERVLKHKLVVGGVVLLVAASAGGAYAATQSGASSRQAFLNDVANRLNVSPSQLRSAVQGALLDRLAAAVKAGELTQAQADRLKQRIEQNGGLPIAPLGGRRWDHGFGPGAPGFGPPAPGTARDSLFGAAARYLGVSQARVLGDLQGGKTLAQIAQGQGKSVSGLEAALVSAAKTRLDRLVSSGVITKAQEQRRLTRLSGRIGQLVNHVRIFRGAGDRPPGPWGPPGVPPAARPPGAPAPGAPPPGGPSGITPVAPLPPAS